MDAVRVGAVLRRSDGEGVEIHVLASMDDYVEGFAVEGVDVADCCVGH